MEMSGSIRSAFVYRLKRRPKWKQQVNRLSERPSLFPASFCRRLRDTRRCPSKRCDGHTRHRPNFISVISWSSTSQPHRFPLAMTSCVTFILIRAISGGASKAYLVWSLGYPALKWHIPRLNLRLLEMEIKWKVASYDNVAGFHRS